MWLTRLREEMVSVPSPGPTQPVATPTPPDPSMAEIHQLRARVAEFEVEKEELRKERARSLSVPAPDLPGAFSQGIVPLEHLARDRSELMATLIENGGTVAGRSNRSKSGKQLFGRKVPSRDSLVLGMGCEGFVSERRPPVCPDIEV